MLRRIKELISYYIVANVIQLFSDDVFSLYVMYDFVENEETGDLYGITPTDDDIELMGIDGAIISSESEDGNITSYVVTEEDKYGDYYSKNGKLIIKLKRAKIVDTKLYTNGVDNEAKLLRKTLFEIYGDDCELRKVDD